MDISFSIIEQHQHYLGQKNPVKENSPHPYYSSVDEFVPFGQESKLARKHKKPNRPYKNKDDIDPLIWDDFMSKIKRDPGLNYVPEFNNFPEARNLPDHLMAPNVATNIFLFNEKTVDNNTIAPTLYLNLPEVGIQDKPNPPQPNILEKPVSLPPTPPPQPNISEKPVSLPPTPPQPNISEKSVSLPPTPPPQPNLPVPPNIPVPVHPSPPKLPLPHQDEEFVPTPRRPGLSSIPPPPPLPPVTRPALSRTRPSQPGPSQPRPPPSPAPDLFSELVNALSRRRVDLVEEGTNNTKPQELDEWKDE